MPWPEHISEKFERVEADPNPRVRENHWYAAWLALLSEHFPSVEHWSIYPQWSVPMNLEPSQVPGGVKGLVDFTVTFVIQKHEVPVFILEIKPAYWLTSTSSRIRADIQMFNQFSRIWDNENLLPTLYGLSAAGTAFAVYKFDKTSRRLSPSRPKKLLPNDYFEDIVPKSQWGFDVMEEQGAVKFKEIAAQIHTMTAQTTSVQRS